MESQREIAEHRVEIEAGLPPGNALHITSKANRAFGTTAGRVNIVDRTLAARCIAQDTHALSTPDEIEGWLTDQQQRRTAILQQQAEDHPQAYVDKNILDAITQSATRAAIAARQPTALKEK